MAIVGSAMQIAFWSIVIPTAIFFLIKLVGDFFYAIGTMLFRVMDMLQSVFRKLAGLGTVYVDGEAVEGDILTYIMKSNVVVDVLIAVAVFGLGLVILGSIVQMIRLEYTTEGSKNSKDKIFTTALKSLLMFVMIPIVCFVGIRLSNYLLQAIDYATSSSGASTVSGSVFQSSTADASKVYTRDNWGNGADIGALLTSLLSGKDYNNAVVKIDSSQAKIMHFEKDFNVNTSEAGSELSIGGLFGDIVAPDNKSRSCERLAQKVGEAFVSASVDDEGTITVGYTPISTAWYSGTCLEANDKLSYLDTEAVSYFYNTGNINYLILYLGAYICIKALFEAAMGMIARIYKVVALFVLAPAAIGLQPIDDGGAYKKWKGSFIQNVLSAYGFIVALNLYFMVVGVLQTIELWNGWGSWLPNKFVQFLFVLTGATMIKDLSGMIGGLIGAADAMADGAKASGEVGKLAGSVMKVGMGAAQLGGAAFKGIGAAAAKWKPTQKVATGEKNIFGKEKMKYDWSSSLGWQETKANFGNLTSRAAEKIGFKKNDDGNYINKKGKELGSFGSKVAGKIDSVKSYGKNLTSEAEDRMKTDKKLAEQSEKATRRSIAAGQNMNRFTSMVADSGLAKNFNNITGNLGSYMSGKAYKGVDEKYQKDLAEAGVDPELYGAPKAGTTFVSRANSAVLKAAGISSTAGIQKNARAQNLYAHNEKQKQIANDTMKQYAEDHRAETKELSDKKRDINTKLIKSKAKHSDIDNSSGYDDQATNIADTKKFLDKIKNEYISGGTMDDSQLSTLLSNFQSSSAYGNDVAKKIADEIEAIMTNPSLSKAQAREMLGKNANINIDHAELGHQMRDSANQANIDRFGSSKDRQAYQDGKNAIGAINEKLKADAKTYMDAKTKHNDLTADGKVVKIAGKDGYAEQMAKEVGDAMKKANEELAKKLKNEGIKAQFGEDLKFKINDEPIITALTRIKEKMDQMERDRKAKESGDTNKLLKQLIEETKKKK